MDIKALGLSDMQLTWIEDLLVEEIWAIEENCKDDKNYEWKHAQHVDALTKIRDIHIKLLEEV